MHPVLQQRAALNRADVTLEADPASPDPRDHSPLTLTIEPPSMGECIIAGGVPVPLLMQMASTEGNGDGPPDGERLTKLLGEDGGNFDALRRYQRALVSKCVKAIEGEPIEGDELTPEEVRAFSERQFNALVGYASRETPLPGKV